MSSVFNVPEILALAISLASAPVDGAARSGLDKVDFNPVVARQMLANYRRRQSVRWSDFGYDGQAWLQAIKVGGSELGYGRYAARIFKTRAGRYYVPLAADRQAIRRLRRDITAVFLLTGRRVAELNKLLGAQLGRRPKPVELLMAQKFGANAAGQIIALASKQPSVSLAGHLPQLAFQHIGLFFGAKRARTAGEVYRLVSRAYATMSRRVKGRTGWNVLQQAIAGNRGGRGKGMVTGKPKTSKLNRRLNFADGNALSAMQWDRPFRKRLQASRTYSVAKLLH